MKNPAAAILYELSKYTYLRGSLHILRLINETRRFSSNSSVSDDLRYHPLNYFARSFVLPTFRGCLKLLQSGQVVILMRRLVMCAVRRFSSTILFEDFQCDLVHHFLIFIQEHSL